MSARPPFADLLDEIRACHLCEKRLPLGARPVLQAHPKARILIAGQAPGKRVHETGIPFDDLSGDRLCDWMEIDRDTFHDPRRIAVLPMGFCYPGTGPSGDLPPRPECAPAWRERLLNELDHIRLTLVIGQYAQAWHLPKTYRTLTETVRHWHKFAPAVFPLPHPSPRNNIWLKKNPWFTEELQPVLAREVRKALLR
ncbi:MAG: uracil-DNA glycosylase family protein [Woeseia sp.]